MFTNCRFGMIAGPLIILSYAAKQHELMELTDALAVSVVLQLIYIAKFFYRQTQAKPLISIRLVGRVSTLS